MYNYNNQNNYNPYGNGLDTPMVMMAPKERQKKKDKKHNRSSSSSSSDEEKGGYLIKNDENQTGVATEKYLRSGFVTKVYSILSVQMVFTTFICGISMSSKSVLEFQLQYKAIFFIALALSFIVVIILVCSRDCARNVPNNYILLAIFTMCQSYMVSIVCGLYNPRLVFLAAFLTLAIFFTLTLYACTAKTDFTLMGGALSIASVCLFLFGMGLMFTDNNAAHLVKALSSAALFGMYILYDTQLIIGTKSYKYSIDDYVLASLELYIDILGLFISILEALQRSNSSGESGDAGGGDGGGGDGGGGDGGGD